MTEHIQNTHPKINSRLVGTVVELGQDRARVELVATEEMEADARGLVHGGFTFGVADYAAMLAVNDPHVVLGAAESRFLAPAVVGDKLVATAAVVAEKGKKRKVTVSVAVGDKVIFEGQLTCFVLSKHVLDH